MSRVPVPFLCVPTFPALSCHAPGRLGEHVTRVREGANMGGGSTQPISDKQGRQLLHPGAPTDAQAPVVKHVGVQAAGSASATRAMPR